MSKYHPQTVSVVIPAFNEAHNLFRVLDRICEISWLERIIVVDDGSSDNTLSIAQQYASHDGRLMALQLPQNQGKAAAMLAGVRAIQTEFVIFMDADLVGVQSNHFEDLYQPVATGACQMSIAIFRHGGVLTDASHLVAPHLSGQRCLRRLDAEQILISLADTRYGAETGLTAYAKGQNWRIQKVVWQGVTHRMKEQKRKSIAGLYSRWQMYQQIAAVWAACKLERLVQWRLAPKQKHIFSNLR